MAKTIQELMTVENIIRAMGMIQREKTGALMKCKCGGDFLVSTFPALKDQGTTCSYCRASGPPTADAHRVEVIISRLVQRAKMITGSHSQLVAHDLTLAAEEFEFELRQLYAELSVVYDLHGVTSTPKKREHPYREPEPSVPVDIPQFTFGAHEAAVKHCWDTDEKPAVPGFDMDDDSV